MKKLAEQGVESIDVFCPGFSADCLETLEEIAVENRDYFLESGGSQFRYIPALNDDTDHIAALKAIIEKNIVGDFQERQRIPQETGKRAVALGAKQ